MNISNAFTVACGTCEHLLNSTNGYNVLEDMFWTKGMHHISFGVNYLRNTLVSDGVNNANGQFNFTGQYTKDGLVDFMLGQIQSLYQGNNSAVDFRKNYGGLYFQDSIQFSPRLTMNAGLRWATGLPAIETTGRGASSHWRAIPLGPNPLYIPQLLLECSSMATREFRTATTTANGTGLNPASASCSIHAAREKKAFALPTVSVSRSRRSTTTPAMHRCRRGATRLL